MGLLEGKPDIRMMQLQLFPGNKMLTANQSMNQSSLVVNQSKAYQSKASVFGERRAPSCGYPNKHPLRMRGISISVRSGSDVLNLEVDYRPGYSTVRCATVCVGPTLRALEGDRRPPYREKGANHDINLLQGVHDQ